ncbi:MAG TPA: thioredoxin domain-containing protein [Fluviicola sp.]|nr:thioredoxin domain-containing protein [Fluviicola sp.]
MEKYTNALARESSLYLLQHAHNPVNWVSWSPAIFEQAAKENKLVLVSVGYSACHWCHVMEHECFEDEEVAALMNKFFICIKVDREERPDVDQVYMNAVQLMTQRGGWPLNCFTLPNGQPIYGGTYFPKEQWMHILRSLQHMFTEEPEKVAEYAAQLTEGIQQSELIEAAVPITDLPVDKLPELVRRWLPQMDNMEGGPTRAPKFPLPNNYLFLLHYSEWQNHEAIRSHVKLTLEKMARGGIYDQLGGGFSRYSVDMLWKVPHFEKMLYDNGQLLSLYAQAYRCDPQPEYKWVLESTLGWLEREMLGKEGGLFATQDADSEGVEGKYYVWTPDEIKTILGSDAHWYLELYNPKNKGFWEHNQWILLRDASWEQFCKAHPGVTVEKIETCNELLFAERKRRVAPATDTKCLTAWNAMTITGLLDASIALNEPAFLAMAARIGEWISTFQLYENNRLWHTRQNGKSFISGFLEDYAFTIEAFLLLYQVTGHAEWLERASGLTEHTLADFFDEASGMFFFTPESHELIARKMELNDNVTPASNGVMAQNLLTMSLLLERDDWKKIAHQQLQNMLDGMEHYGSGYSNWALLLQRFLRPSFSVKVQGTVDEPAKSALLKLISPQTVLVYEPAEENGFVVCGDGMCWPKVDSVDEATEQIKRQFN